MNVTSFTSDKSIFLSWKSVTKTAPGGGPTTARPPRPNVASHETPGHFIAQLLWKWNQCEFVVALEIMKNITAICIVSAKHVSAFNISVIFKEVYNSVFPRQTKQREIVVIPLTTAFRLIHHRAHALDFTSYIYKYPLIHYKWECFM